MTTKKTTQEYFSSGAIERAVGLSASRMGFWFPEIRAAVEAEENKRKSRMSPAQALDFQSNIELGIDLVCAKFGVVAEDRDALRAVLRGDARLLDEEMTSATLGVSEPTVAKYKFRMPELRPLISAPGLLRWSNVKVEALRPRFDALRKGYDQRFNAAKNGGRNSPSGINWC